MPLTENVQTRQFTYRAIHLAPGHFGIIYRWSEGEFTSDVIRSLVFKDHNGEVFNLTSPEEPVIAGNNLSRNLRLVSTGTVLTLTIP